MVIVRVMYLKYMKCSGTTGFCFGFGQIYYYYHQHVFFLNQVLVCFVNCYLFTELICDHTIDHQLFLY